MSDLHEKLLKEFRDKTGFEPTYIAEGITFHTLQYFTWLEEKINSTNSQNTKCMGDGCTNDAIIHVCEYCAAKMINA